VDPVDPVDPVGPVFSDVSEGNVHLDNILALASDGIVLGYADGTFRPARSITRGQVASVLARAAGFEGRTPQPPSFTDIASSAHRGSIEALAAEGIVTGFPDGTFRPNVAVTRGQAASLLGRWLGLDQVTGGPFADVPDSSPHAGYINALVGMGVVTGRTPTSFAPNLDIRRDQFASLLHRAR
jgi:hypothetical protein